MTIDPILAAPPGFLELRDRFDDQLLTFLSARRQEAEWVDPRATLLIDEVTRLIEAGGKRLRPAFCYWGYRAAGGADDVRIIKGAAALELLHTFALIHDDLMDGSEERRGVPSTQVRFAQEAGVREISDPERFARSAALLAGDLANVMADQLLLEAGFVPATLGRALGRYHEMRTEMAMGQLLDLLITPIDEHEARRLAAMKGGNYTIERPLLLGATLASGTIQQLAVLSRFGGPLGEAFQLSDDLLDEGPTLIDKEGINLLVEQAVVSLDADVLEPVAVEALTGLAALIALP